MQLTIGNIAQFTQKVHEVYNLSVLMIATSQFMIQYNNRLI